MCVCVCMCVLLVYILHVELFNHHNVHDPTLTLFFFFKVGLTGETTCYGERTDTMAIPFNHITEEQTTEVNHDRLHCANQLRVGQERLCHRRLPLILPDGQ